MFGVCAEAVNFRTVLGEGVCDGFGLLGGEATNADRAVVENGGHLIPLVG